MGRIADMADKPFWEKDAPKDAKEKHLNKKQVTMAKARARAAGRPYPNLVDNVAAARAGKKD
jgi:hypothetical protein